MGEIPSLKLIADDGKGSYEIVRRGSRAILFKEGKLLLGRERIGGYCTLPGGGHEGNETLEETCAREVAEEMGILVEVQKKFAIVEASYKERIYENHFFVCTYLGETQKHQTEQEEAMELSPIWVTIEEARNIFSDPSTKDKNEAWICCYKRDLWIIENIIAKGL